MSVQDELLSLPRFCTIGETADFLGVSRSTVRRYIETGNLEQWRLESGRKKVLRDSIGRLCGLDVQESTLG